MHRLMRLFLVVLWPTLVIGGESIAGEKPATLIPDPNYTPKVGDRAVLYSLDTENIPFDLWCAPTSEACRNFLNSLLAGEAENEEDAEDAGRTATAAEAKLLHLAPKTEVELLARETVEFAGASEGMPLKCTYFAVQVLSGPAQGQTLYTLDFHITRLIPSSAPLGAEAKSDAVAAAKAEVIAKAETPEATAAPTTAGAPIELEILDAPAAPPSSTQAPESAAPVAGPAAPPIELETSEIPVTKREAPSPPEPSRPQASAPPELELETPATAVTNQKNVPIETSAAPGPVTLESSNDSNTSAGVMPTTTDTPVPLSAVPDAPPSLKPEAPAPAAPAQKVEAVESSQPGEPAVAPSTAAATEEQLPPQARATEEPTAVVAPPAASLSNPPAPLPEPQPLEPGVSGQTTSVTPAPKPSSPNTSTPSARPQTVRQAASHSGRPPISAPTKPRTPAELLSVARERDQSGKALDALVAYRVLERTHPATSEAQFAVKRIKELTEKLEVDTQEARAALVLKQARSLEASGKGTLALGYFQQIVRVYPKTPTARLAAERIKSIGAGQPGSTQ